MAGWEMSSRQACLEFALGPLHLKAVLVRSLHAILSASKLEEKTILSPPPPPTPDSLGITGGSLRIKKKKKYIANPVASNLMPYYQGVSKPDSQNCSQQKSY